jgi:hypothetical protein
MSRRNSFSTILLISLLLLAGVYFVARARTGQKLTAFAQAKVAPTQILWREGSWYWLEADGKSEARLVRADASGARPLATADKIAGYAVADGKLVWAAKEGDQWNLAVAAPDASGKRTLYSGEREPRGLCLANGYVFWLEPMPPAVPESGPLPPLAGMLRLLSLPLDGGVPKVIATLLESESGQVLGVHADQAYVAATRLGTPGATLLYRVSLREGVVQRVAGEAGQHTALLTREGSLFWVAPSLEDSRMNASACIRRLGQDGKAETLADWLPANGRLYDTVRGVVYVDGGFEPSAWPIANRRELPRAVPLPREHTVLALGSDEMLLGSANATPANIPLYRTTLP